MNSRGGRKPAPEAGSGTAAWQAGAVEAGGAWAWEWDAASDRLRCSAGLAQAIGWADGDEGSGALDDLLARVHPEDRTAVAETMRQAAVRREEFRLEFRLLAADGSTLWLEGRGRALRDAAAGDAGEAAAEARLGGLMLPLLERRLAAHALAESEARLRAVVETAVDGIITIDERGAILTANPAAERLFGYRAAEMVGRNVSMLMPEPYHSEHDGYLRHYLETGERRIIGIGREVVGHRRDGSVFPMDLAVSETVLAGRRFFTGLVRDITARKQAEQALHESRAQLAQLNASLEQRVAQRTLDLRRQSEQLRRLAAALTDAELGERKRIARILHDHVQQLLVAARMRIGAGRAHLAPPQAENLAEAERILDEVIASTRTLTARLRPAVLHEQGLPAALRWLAQDMERHHALRVACEVDDDAQVPLEPAGNLLYEAARELLFNVVKHAKAAEARLRFSAGAPGFRLEVEDSGRGFDPEAEQAREAPGGFGLFSLRERLAALGGSLRHDSRPGGGTRAEVTLPVAG